MDTTVRLLLQVILAEILTFHRFKKKLRFKQLARYLFNLDNIS